MCIIIMMLRFFSLSQRVALQSNSRVIRTARCYSTQQTGEEPQEVIVKHLEGQDEGVQ